MALRKQDRRPEGDNPNEAVGSPLTRPRYVSLIGGAITALSIILFGAFAGIQTVTQPVPLVMAVGFSVAVHYLFATFTIRSEHKPGA